MAALQNNSDTYGTLYLYVNELLPDDGVVVDMRAYITNSSMTSEDELDLLWSGLFFVANSSDGFFDPSLLVVESTGESHYNGVSRSHLWCPPS